VLEPLYVWQENFPKESPASLIMLCGDCNARVGCENDFITKDNNNFNPSFDCYVSDSARLRMMYPTQFIFLVFNNVLFNKIKDTAILVMRGGRLDWRIINKTSINVFFKIKKKLFKDKPVMVDLLGTLLGNSPAIHTMAQALWTM
jgi:hypothetical protein